MTKEILLTTFLMSIFLSYHLEAQISCTSANLWVNGSFEDTSIGNHCNELNPINAYSNSGFPNYGYTTFTYAAGGTAIQPGILNEPSYDHTTGSVGGHYFYLDPRFASGPTYQIRQQIKVKKNVTYTFSFWVTSMLTWTYQDRPANLQLKVNDSDILSNSIIINGTTTNWILISGTWTSTTDTIVNAEIVDINPTVGGHDFAIDDIFFGAGDIRVFAGVDTIIATNQQFTLGGQPTADFGATCNNEYNYSWSPTTGFATADDIANPKIQLPTSGSYTYTVTVTDLNRQSCSDTVTITVQEPNSIKDNNIYFKGINLYPNPTSNLITISRDNSAKAITLFLYNDIGNRKINKHIGQNISESKINIKPLDNGIYYYQILSEKGNILKSGTIVKN